MSVYRTQRCLMLETPSFWEQLVCLATGEQKEAEARKWDFPCFEHAQIVALDILAWLASVQMNQKGCVLSFCHFFHSLKHFTS